MHNISGLKKIIFEFFLNFFGACRNIINFCSTRYTSPLDLCMMTLVVPGRHSLEIHDATGRGLLQEGRGELDSCNLSILGWHLFRTRFFSITLNIHIWSFHSKRKTQSFEFAILPPFLVIFFSNYINIFHKTKALMVILRG